MRNIPSGVCVYRLEDERIFPVYHNPAFYEILGYSKEHISRVEKKMPFSGVIKRTCLNWRRNLKK